MVGSKTGRSKLHDILGALVLIATMVATYLPGMSPAYATTLVDWGDAPYYTVKGEPYNIVHSPRADVSQTLESERVNPTCGSLDPGASGEVKFEGRDLTSGTTLPSGDGLLEVTLENIRLETIDGVEYKFFDFTVDPESERGVAAAFVKQSTGGAYFEYGTSDSYGDTYLHPQSWSPADISHISFCYVDVPPETYDLTLTKVDAVTEAAMAEVGFKLFADEDMEVPVGTEKFTDADGEIVWTELLPGTYWLFESTVPTGYDPMIPNPLLVEIVDEDVTVTIDNTLTPVPPETYVLTLTKVDAVTEAAMAEVGFELFAGEDMDDQIGTEKLTDTDGEIVWTDLLPGTYWLYESTVPTGYDPMIPNPLEVEIVDEDVTVTIDNTLTPVPPETYVLTLTKVDGFTEEAMAEVGFELFADEDMDDQIGTEKLTDTDGEIVWTDLLPGTYWLYESTVPTGYDPMTPNPLEVEIVDEDVTLTIENESAAVLPGTLGIELVKTAKIAPNADGDKVVDYDAGDADGAKVVYLYEITNTGTVPITDLDLTDDVLGDIVLPKSTIEPGEKITATATHLVTGDDADEGEIVNVATVTGDSELGAVEATDTETVLVTEVKGVLVVTGADTGAMALTALLALLLGAALVLTERRRSAER